jgi:hypothetical protein
MTAQHDRYEPGSLLKKHVADLEAKYLVTVWMCIDILRKPKKEEKKLKKEKKAKSEKKPKKDKKTKEDKKLKKSKSQPDKPDV